MFSRRRHGDASQAVGWGLPHQLSFPRRRESTPLYLAPQFYAIGIIAGFLFSSRRHDDVVIPAKPVLSKACPELVPKVRQSKESKERESRCLCRLRFFAPLYLLSFLDISIRQHINCLSASCFDNQYFASQTIINFFRALLIAVFNTYRP